MLDYGKHINEKVNTDTALLVSFFFLCSTGDRTQGLVFSMQALYSTTWATLPVLLVSVFQIRYCTNFVRAGLRSQSSYIHLLNSWDYKPTSSFPALFSFSSRGGPSWLLTVMKTIYAIIKLMKKIDAKFRCHYCVTQSNKIGRRWLAKASLN